jgi:chemotaxis protein MotA
VAHGERRRGKNDRPAARIAKSTGGNLMIVIVGCIIVVGAVLAGFTMAGGHIGALMHLSEIVTIGGASLGALIVMSPKNVLVDVLRSMVQVVKGSPYNRQAYAELFALLGDITRKIRRDGILALEPLILEPHSSPILAKYPRIHKNHHATEFLCAGLSMFLDGVKGAEQLTGELEKEIRVVEQEHHAAVSVLAKTADALPGFGIVAAVLGIVITMQAIDGPASEIGHKVGAALVGTFLGILLSYGFFGPMSARMEFLGEAELTFLRAVASAIVSISEGENAREVIARARRIVGTDNRPALSQIDALVKEGAEA